MHTVQITPLANASDTRRGPKTATDSRKTPTMQTLALCAVALAVACNDDGPNSGGIVVVVVVVVAASVRA